MQPTTATSKKGTAYDRLTNTEQNALQARARELTRGAVYLGTDTEERIHFINRVSGGVVVFDDVADTDPLHIPSHELRAAATPGAWTDHVERVVGPWEDCRLDRKCNSALVINP